MTPEELNNIPEEDRTETHKLVLNKPKYKQPFLMSYVVMSYRFRDYTRKQQRDQQWETIMKYTHQ